VVKYVEAGHTYTEAAAKFNVSYQQARLWTVKFNKDGIEALKDNRGHNKATQSGSEVDELKQEIRVLKKKLYDQETIIMFQKKLKELQQRE
jgi:transposase